MPIGAQRAVELFAVAHPDFRAAWVSYERGVYAVGDASYGHAFSVDPGTGHLNGFAELNGGTMGLLANLHDCAFTCPAYPGRSTRRGADHPNQRRWGPESFSRNGGALRHRALSEGLSPRVSISRSAARWRQHMSTDHPPHGDTPAKALRMSFQAWIPVQRTTPRASDEPARQVTCHVCGHADFGEDTPHEYAIGLTTALRCQMCGTARTD